MRQLIVVVGFQLLFGAVAGALAGALMWWLGREGIVAVLMVGLPTAILVGTAAGAVIGRPRAPSRVPVAVRVPVGAIAGLMSASYAGFALALVVTWILGRFDDDVGFTWLVNRYEPIAWAIGVLGAVLGGWRGRSA